MRHDPDWLVEAIDNPSSDCVEDGNSSVLLLIRVDRDAATGRERNGGNLLGDSVKFAGMQLGS